jgi:hypothetical protein
MNDMHDMTNVGTVPRVGIVPRVGTTSVDTWKIKSHEGRERHGTGPFGESCRI